MFSEINSIKRECCSEHSPKEQYIDVIQLTEDKECGEIINDYWMILPSDLPWNNYKGKYQKGYYVKIVDIRCLDMFSTDINYDNRDDLIKVGKRNRPLNLDVMVLNLYSVA